MRKRIVGQTAIRDTSKFSDTWLDLEQIATVEVTSEDSSFPVESVFNARFGPGWRAIETGDQQIRLLFDQPISIKRVLLRFSETELERTQEFVLSWLSAEGGAQKE